MCDKNANMYLQTCKSLKVITTNQTRVYLLVCFFLFPASCWMHCLCLTSNTFLQSNRTIRSLQIGGQRKGMGGKWALSHQTIPLFQLPWPRMPHFTAHYPPPDVNQSSLRSQAPPRTGLAHPRGPSHHNVMNQCASVKGCHTRKWGCHFFCNMHTFKTKKNFYIVIYSFIFCCIKKMM